MFDVAGSLRGRHVRVRWLDAERGRPARLDGDPALVAEVGQAVYERQWVAATPTGPSFIAALEPDYVALVTICAALDPDVVPITVGAPVVPGVETPADAVA